MVSETADAHDQYKTDGDHERFFGVCAAHVSAFLSALARYLGARASTIGPHKPDSLLDERLAQFELIKWSRLFESDLAAFAHGLEEWANFEKIHFINRHFERLLFEVGVFPDQLDDGSLYIHTSHEHRLSGKA